MEKYDVFISYRRDGGSFAAKNIQGYLQEHGYRVFFDMDSLRAGVFSEKILDVIEECQDFILILSPHALDRCANEGDWVRRELSHAIAKKKNIIPVMLNGFNFPEELPADIDAVRWQNGMSPSMELWDASMKKLTSFMKAKPIKRIQMRAVVVSVAAVVLVSLGLLFLRTMEHEQPVPELAAAQVTETASESSVEETSAETEVIPETEVISETEAIPETETSAAEQAVEVHVMRKTPGANDGNSDFWGQNRYRRGQIETATFLSSMENVPEDCWDMSEKQNGSILAWVEDGKNLYIAADGVISPNEDGSELFTNFRNLRTIDFGDAFDTSGVRNFAGVFGWCEKLNELDIASWDVSNVTDMSDMFKYCKSLSGLELSNWDVSHVTAMNGMFHTCKNMRVLGTENWDTGNVKEMSCMFAFCENLEYLELANWNTSKVRDMQWLFYNCASLRDAQIESWDVSNVSNMNSMFYGCAMLRELDLSAWDVSKVSDMGKMFCGCSGMLRIDLSGWKTTRLAVWGGMFSGCGKQTELISDNEKFQWEFKAR